MAVKVWDRLLCHKIFWYCRKLIMTEEKGGPRNYTHCHVLVWPFGFKGPVCKIWSELEFFLSVTCNILPINAYTKSNFVFLPIERVLFIYIIIFLSKGDTVAQWLACSKMVVGSFHSPKTYMWGQLGTLYCICECLSGCMSLFAFLCGTAMNWQLVQGVTLTAGIGSRRPQPLYPTLSHTYTLIADVAW